MVVEALSDRLVGLAYVHHCVDQLTQRRSLMMEIPSEDGVDAMALEFLDAALLPMMALNFY